MREDFFEIEQFEYQNRDNNSMHFHNLSNRMKSHDRNMYILQEHFHRPLMKIFSWVHTDIFDGYRGTAHHSVTLRIGLKHIRVWHVAL